jgi:antitoxin MazE
MNGDDIMEARLQKWGNSVGIRIPHSILKDLNLKINDLINIEKIDDKVVMTKQLDPKISLAERFANYHGDNLAKEFEWDEPVGREIW